MSIVSLDESVRAFLTRYGAQSVSVQDVLCDAHDGIAVDYLDATGDRRLSYADLREQSMRLAGALRTAGVGAGSAVAVMLPKSPELVTTLIAIWRLGAVHVPLFTAFGPDAVRYRVIHSEARAVITNTLHRPKFADSDLDGIPVFCLADGGETAARRDLDLVHEIEQAEPLEGSPRQGDDPLILLYTSGTTGQPKGVEMPVRALASIHSYMQFGLDVRPDDVFWNIADPGWGYGLWFAVVGPLMLGRATLMSNLPFDAEGVLWTIADRGVTNLTGAPTVFRSIRAAGVPAWFRDRSALRAISSAGEPLNGELLEWSIRELGLPIHDHYGQSELGMPAGFAHFPQLHRDPVAGSMGVAAPGFRVVVLDDTGHEVDPGVEGELAIDVDASPLYWFRGYFHDTQRTAERFALGARYHLTGDRARFDGEGLLRFASRADDVITSSGYRIGPFEVESVLMAHPAVSEVAVVGTPDELRGEAVTAFVVPRIAGDATPKVAEELKQFVKGRLAAHLYPRRVVFVEQLPRTPSGKVQRAALRARWSSEALGARR
jgi:acetyl-CoA synthetase